MNGPVPIGHRSALLLPPLFTDVMAVMKNEYIRYDTSIFLLSLPMTKTLANGEPVRKRTKAAKITPLLKAHKKAVTTAAHNLNVDIEVAINNLDNVIDELAVKHGKSFKVVQELLHLGGHVLKSRHSAGINNTYAHCEARCETTCSLHHFFQQDIYTDYHYL
jgi:hypothetical protein